MRIFLRNYNEWQSIILFDLNTNEIKNLSDKEKKNIDPVGVFKLINEKILAFYYYCGDIQLFYNKCIFSFKDILEINLDDKGYFANSIKAEIKLKNDESIIINEVITVKRFISDFTQTDEEDFSILRFIFNIFNNKERQNLLKENW
jgi:hypothetical protein